MKIANMLDQHREQAAEKIYHFSYARKSSESEDRQMASIESQSDALRDLERQKSLAVLKKFTDSYSAKAPGRKGFNEMVEEIEKRNDIKGIIVWDISRLFRNPIDEGRIRWLLDSGKIEEIITPFKSYKKDDSSLIMAIEGGSSQKFIQDLRRNTKRGVDKKIEMGIFPGLAPVGYVNDMTLRQGERDIKPHPIYFDLVKHILKMALTGKYSTVALVRKAEAMGIKTSRGQSISKPQMYSLLRNPFYCGWFLYAMKLYKGIHEPMITKREFDSIQEVLEGKAIVHKPNDFFSLRGLVTCGYCNYGIIGERHTKKSGLVFDYYTCTSKKKRGGCLQGFHPADDLENQVSDFLGSLKVSEKFLSWATKWLKETELQDRQVRVNSFTALRSEHGQIEKQLNNLTDKWLTGQLEDDEYQNHKSRYTQRLQDIDEGLKQADDDWEKWTDYAIKTMQFARMAQEKWQSGTMDDKKTILTVIGSNLVLKDNKLEITPKSPFLAIKKAVEAQKLKTQGSNAQAEANFQNSLILGGLTNEVRTRLIASSASDLEIYKHHIFV